MVNLVKEAQESKKKIILSAMVAGLAVIAKKGFEWAGELEYKK